MRTIFRTALAASSTASRRNKPLAIRPRPAALRPTSIAVWRMRGGWPPPPMMDGSPRWLAPAGGGEPHHAAARPGGRPHRSGARRRRGAAHDRRRPDRDHAAAAAGDWARLGLVDSGRDRRHPPVPERGPSGELRRARAAGRHERRAVPLWSDHQRGSPWLRWALIEAAIHGTTRSDRIGRWGRSLAVKKGALKARVALARVLCEEIHRRWSKVA